MEEEQHFSDECLSKLMAGTVGEPEKEGMSTPNKDNQEQPTVETQSGIVPLNSERSPTPQPKAEIQVKNYRLDIALYPMRCPCCGNAIEVNGKIYPKLYPIGSTRKGFSAKVKKKKGSSVKFKDVKDVKQRGLLE